METKTRNVWAYVSVALLTLVLLAPELIVPTTGAEKGLRIFAIQSGAFALLALTLARMNWSLAGLKRFLAFGPNFALVLLIGWAAISFAMTAPASGYGHEMAQAELLRLGCGVAVYFGALYGTRSRTYLRLMSLVLLIGGLLAAAAGIFSCSPSAMHLATGAFNDKQLLGAFLGVLLPVAVVFALPHQLKVRRQVALLALPLIGIALLLTVNRSSWLGSLAGLAVVVCLKLRSASPHQKKFAEFLRLKRRQIAALSVALCVFCCVFTLNGGSALVATRWHYAINSGTLSSRLRLWSDCKQMLLDKPLTGWGIGSFPLKAGEYSVEVPSTMQVMRQGVSLSSMAHNEYLQLTAELGLIGLLLYLAVLGCFFSQGIRSLRDMGNGTRKSLLLACLGAVAAQCVDAIGNPGWHFRDVSPLFWLLLGLGVAATQRESEARVKSGQRAFVPRSLKYYSSRVAGTAFALLFGAVLIVASLSGSIGRQAAMRAMEAAHRPLFVPGPLYKYEIIADTATDGFVELDAYSINDQGAVAFTGKLNGSRNTDVFVSSPTGDLRNVTAASNTDRQRDYFYGGVQLNNAGVVVATQKRIARFPLFGNDLNAVGIWSLGGAAQYIAGPIEETFSGPTFLNATINNFNQAVFNEANQFSSELVDESGNRVRLADRRTALSPMIADNGVVVVKAGDRSADPIRLYRRGTNFPPLDIATAAMGFTRLGSQPGVSDDGRVVVFYGELNLLSLMPGPGIFAAIDEGASGWKIQRLTGQRVEDNNAVTGNLDGICDTGEACVQAAELGYTLDPTILPSAPQKAIKLYFDSYEPDERIGVIRQDLGTPGSDLEGDSFVVAFMATPNGPSRRNPALPGRPLEFSEQKGLWTLRVDVQRELGPVSNHNRVYHATALLPVVQLGDRLGNLIEVRSISIYDPIAQAATEDDGTPRNYPHSPRRGDHRLTFLVKGLGGSAVVRASRLDSDEDGLPDHWETDGIDMNGDGVPDLNLPAMGANRFKRDLFVEIDWLRPRDDRPLNLEAYSNEPAPGVTAMLVKRFRCAPALPNGIPKGITLHIDAGDGNDFAGQPFSQNMGTEQFLWGGSLIRQLPDECPMLSDCFVHLDLVYFGLPKSIKIPGLNAASFDEVKNEYFMKNNKGARELAFHYVVFSDFFSLFSRSPNLQGYIFTVLNASPDEVTTMEPLPTAVKSGDAVKIVQDTNPPASPAAKQVRMISAKAGHTLTLAGNWVNIPAPGSKLVLLVGYSGRSELFYFGSHSYYDGEGLNGSCADCNSLPGSDVLVTLGTSRIITYSAGHNHLDFPAIQWRTMMHELGHNLGLRHGGENDENHKDGSLREDLITQKSDYRSLMNYTYQHNLDDTVDLYGQDSPVSDPEFLLFDDWLNLKMDFHTTSIHLGNTFGLGFNGAPVNAGQEPSSVDHVLQNEPLPQNVTSRARLVFSGFRYNRDNGSYVQQVTLTNVSGTALAGPVSLLVNNLSSNARLSNRSGVTLRLRPSGQPFIRVDVGGENILSPGESVTVQLEFFNPANMGISYSSRVLAGPGHP